MTAAAPSRGSWLWHQAFVRQWADSGLNSVFSRQRVEEWGVGNADPDPILIDTEPIWAPRGPSAIFRIDEANIITHMTSNLNYSADVEFQILRVPVEIDIVVENVIGGSRLTSTKAAALDLARHVATHFDSVCLDIHPDEHINTIKEPDFGFTELYRDSSSGESTIREIYHWIVPYSWLIQAAIKRERRQ